MTNTSIWIGIAAALVAVMLLWVPQTQVLMLANAPVYMMLVALHFNTSRH